MTTTFSSCLDDIDKPIHDSIVSTGAAIGVAAVVLVTAFASVIASSRTLRVYNGGPLRALLLCFAEKCFGFCGCWDQMPLVLALSWPVGLPGWLVGTLASINQKNWVLFFNGWIRPISLFCLVAVPRSLFSFSPLPFPFLLLTFSPALTRASFSVCQLVGWRLLCFRYTRGALIAVVIAGAVTGVLKVVISRPRPTFLAVCQPVSTQVCLSTDQKKKCGSAA